MGRKFKVRLGHPRELPVVLPVDRAAAALSGASIGTLYLETIPPTAPVLGTPTSVGSSSMTVPLQTAATDASGILEYRLERATAVAGPWTQVAVGLSIFPYSASSLTALTTYYWRARAVDTFGNIGPYSELVNSTTLDSESFAFYISTTGTGTAAAGGTLANPWPITMLNDATARNRYRGTRVGLLDGVYGMYDLIYPANIYYANAYLNVAGGINAANPTIIEAVNPRLAILDGMSSGGAYLNSGTDSGGALIGAIGSDRSYVTFKNLVVRNHFGTGIMCGHSATGGHNVTAKTVGLVVDGCELYNTHVLGAPSGGNVAALMLWHTSGATVKNCYIHDTYGISLTHVTHNNSILWWDVHDSTIEYCTLVRSPNPIQLKGVANARMTCRYNYLESDPARPDVCIRSDEGQTGGATMIHNNVLVAGASINISTSPWKTAETHIFNNTISGVTVSSVVHHQTSNVNKWLRFYNNIIYRTQASIPGADLEWCADSWTVANNNCYSPNGFKGRAYTPNSTSTNVEYTTLAQWQTRVQQTLTGAEANSFQANPLFMNTGTRANLYKLQPGSDCIAAGRVGGTSGGAAVDMGAWGGATQIGSDF